MGDEPTVLFQTDGATAQITLNRPEKRNALNAALIAELSSSLERVSKDHSIHVALLSGAGDDFCSGADLDSLKTIAGASVEENVSDAHSLLNLFIKIRSVPVPVICAVRGRALAGGCGLATACDIVLASRSSHFGYPEVKIGFVPAMVMGILRKNVPEKKAFEMLVTGAEISAEEALQIGLVNRVFDDETFGDDVARFAQRFQKVSRSAIGLTKRLFYQVDGLAYEDALQFGSDMNVLARLTQDCRLGISRFLDRK